jgi:hypothetical protein
MNALRCLFAAPVLVVSLAAVACGSAEGTEGGPAPEPVHPAPVTIASAGRSFGASAPMGVASARAAASGSPRAASSAGEHE